MDDIRLFETDGDFLVLEAQDGQKFRLLIDDTVRSSIKREKLQQLDSITITPREIQEEIRNGTSIDQLIKDSGATFEFIEKFAAPVIAELEHIVNSALSVRLTIAGDRYNDSTQIEFGEIISARLVTSGASALSWIAKKIEPNSWLIIANYSLNGVAGSASWAFDPRRLTLSPESETAVTLSSQETLNNSVIPKLRTVDVANNNSGSNINDRQETAIMEDVIPIGRGAEFETPIAQEPEWQAFDKPTPSTPAAFLKPVQSETITQKEQPVESVKSAASEPLSATADLLEALRRKRTEREEPGESSGKLEQHPDTTNLRVIDIEPVAQNSAAQNSAAENSAAQNGAETEIETAEAGKTNTPKKGRALMPSWDEIVFGTKTED